MLRFFIVLQILLFTVCSYSCDRESKPVFTTKLQCNIHKKSQRVEFTILDTISVIYAVDSSFLDVSRYLGLENWGPEAIRRYRQQTDTLTITWYDNHGQNIHDTVAVNLISINFAKELSGVFSPPLPLEEVRPKVVDFIGVHGVSSTIIRNGRTNIMFVGINKATDVLVVINYSCDSKNQNAENSFLCLLESMRFSKREREAH